MEGRLSRFVTAYYNEPICHVRPTIIFSEHNDFLADKSEVHRLSRRIAESTDDDELFAGLNQLTDYLTHAIASRR